MMFLYLILILVIAVFCIMLYTLKNAMKNKMNTTKVKPVKSRNTINSPHENIL